MLVVSNTSPISYLVAINLGILDRAAGEGKVDFESAIAQLQETSFRISNALLQSMRRKHTRKIDDKAVEG
jgi:predicted nucleic acid-binding protein